jgi:hypothetical protein
MRLGSNFGPLFRVLTGAQEPDRIARCLPSTVDPAPAVGFRGQGRAPSGGFIDAPVVLVTEMFNQTRG